MSTSNINDEMRQAAEYARKIALEQFGKWLDYSQDSLPAMDHIIENVQQQFPSIYAGENYAGHKELNIAFIWGSYLGELIRANYGGNWIIEDSRRVLVVNSHKLTPIQYVYQRIIGQLHVNVLTYYGDISNKVFLQQITPLQSAPSSQSDIELSNPSNYEKPFTTNARNSPNLLKCPNCHGYKISTSGLTLMWFIFHVILTILTAGAWLLIIFLYVLIARKPKGKYRCQTCGYEWGAF